MKVLQSGEGVCIHAKEYTEYLLHLTSSVTLIMIMCSLTLGQRQVVAEKVTCDHQVFADT